MERRHGAVSKLARGEAALGALLGVGERLDGKVRGESRAKSAPRRRRCEDGLMDLVGGN